MLKADLSRTAKLPGRSASEKMDATTRAALQIINQETAARDAKTARLKALRLAQESAAEAAALAAPPAPPKRPARKSSTKTATKTSKKS